MPITLFEHQFKSYQALGLSPTDPLLSALERLNQDAGNEFIRLDDIWNYQVLPLLKEYFYGQADLLRQVLPSFFNPDVEDQNKATSGPLPLHNEELVAALNRL